MTEPRDEPTTELRRFLDAAAADGPAAVSYTHLTLPTILRV